MATRKKISLDPDFRDFIQLLNSEGVRYLLLGGYAVNYHGHHRFTADIDFWIEPELANAERLSRALQRFGFSADTVKPEQFLELGKVHSIGMEPVRVDLLTGPSGVDFAAAYQRRVVDVLDGVEVSIISLADLRANKQASGRKKDLLDLDDLPEV